MKEFMLIIHSTDDLMDTLSPEMKKLFLKKVQNYIGNLMKEGKLKGAQPLERVGRMISGTKGALKDEPFTASKEIIIGYYHILAGDLNEAIAIAKENPEFEFGTAARIEVRPVKMKEELIDFVYP